ncbi:FERRY endosomal RAB5 effector complex subunit 3-like isoform X1 [Tachypleus tridentatus]|uniref:FERRY endosomal RAB5 effector complex subunit 3-like isoform X1 n=2 Tax=Tachypleus tridentatus TaxID=6853 RepID=UPI003FD601F0
MLSAMCTSLECEFTFTFPDAQKDISASYMVTIPLLMPVKELSYQILDACKLPCYVEEDLLNSLEGFVSEQTKKFLDERSEQNIRPYQTGDADIESLVERWSQAFREEHTMYAKPDEESSETSFSEVYHSLIHSPALDTMLHLEHTYAMAVEEMVREKEETLELLLRRQSKEMEMAVEKVGVVYSDQDINSMAARHFEETERVTEDWNERISRTKEIQRREFREWVTKVHEDYDCGGGSRENTQSRLRAVSEALPLGREDLWTTHQMAMEESFTIHLGSQLKTMHNLRLLAADVLQLCQHKPNRVGGVLVPQPQRLQTAMSLYSSNLCGLVLLVDNRINSYTGIKRDFARVCGQSTEFHFPDLEEQLEGIREQAKLASNWRTANLPQAENTSQGSSGRSSVTPEHQAYASLKPGDFYITKHSNLSDIHVVFHMVTNDSLRSADINSRHPVILGLRNVLRVAHEKDVVNIILPLLLVHEMSEEMTIPWCLRRAELVFKCIKGFMIEMASLGGDETRTVQFLVPRGISEELFSSLASMLPSIFRLSNPLILTSKT